MEQTPHYASLGHELHIGDNVEFYSCGHTVLAHIIDFIGDKAVCIPFGWRGPAEFREKIRKQYKVLSKSCYLLKLKGNPCETKA